MNIKSIGIVGLGLIGGSLAKALKRIDRDLFISGFDINEDSLHQALSEGIIDHISATVHELAVQAQIVFLCTPVNKINKILYSMSKGIRRGTIITDVGSTKEKTVACAVESLPTGVEFIGGHPMAGTEFSGYGASIPHLFENAYYILTPLPTTSPESLDILKGLLSSIGAIPLVMDARLHDRIVGSVSHLPHIVAACLVNTVEEMHDPERYREKLASGGFRDITRIASSNPQMWKDICMSNRQELLGLIEHLLHNLNRFHRYLDSSDDKKIQAFFERARNFRDNLPTYQSLVALPFHELYVDVEDRPGMIGEVTTLLGSHGINIKNLRIINSREGEPGCLVISLSDVRSLDKALAVLAEKNYRTYKK